MQIKIDVKILIFALIFFITGQINIYIILMMFAFFHEMAHLIVGLFLGFRPYLFEMKPIGFSISFYNSVDDYNKKIKKGNMLELKKIFVYLAGPVYNLATAFAFAFFSGMVEFVYINLILFIINILPMYPLDGGRIVKSILSIFCGLRKSYILTEKISFVCVVILLIITSIAIIKVQNFGLLVVVLYLVCIECREAKYIKQKLKLYELIQNK